MYKRLVRCFVCIFIVICCILGICCVFPCDVLALDRVNVFLSSSNSRIESGEEFVVTLNLENAKTAAFTSYLYFDNSKLEYVSGPENTNLVGNCIIFVWYDSNGGNSAIGGKLAEFKFKAKDEGIAYFSVDGEFFDSIGDGIQVNFKELQLFIGNEKNDFKRDMSEEVGTDNNTQNAGLKVLRLDREGLVPSFEEGVYEYYLTVLSDVNYIDVLAIADNPNATIEIVGNNNLTDGLNTITVKIISEDKTQSAVYSIYVTKTSDVELANANLEILAIENVLLYPQFDTNTTNYKIDVSNDISNVNVFAVPENENAIVEIKGNDKLNEGKNLISVSVTAVNGFSKRVYEINAYRRNAEEEVLFKESQRVNEESLKEIYNVDKVSDEFDEKDDEVIGIKKKQGVVSITIITVMIFIVVILLIIFMTIRKYIYNKK